MPEEITPEAFEMKRQAEERERKIVRFTNIDNESFTHSYSGISRTVAAGRSFVGRLPECDHLAMHLARKILAREKKTTTKEGNLWNNKEVDTMKEKILSPLGEEGEESKSLEQIRIKDSEELEKRFQPKVNQIDEEGGSNKNNPVIVSKKDVITDLEKRGVKADISKSKEELLAQLLELEAQGVEPR
uniref:Uncharacterized protein n=1 Tax=viral metagenome TaxID=1070528 RepID=A0A6M3ILK2_9ZZZZ